jgi:hypothetical protein
MVTVSTVSITRQSPRAGHNVASNVENLLPPLLNSNNYQDNLEEVSVWPAISQGKYLLQRLLPKPPPGTSIGLTFATIWRFRI